MSEEDIDSLTVYLSELEIERVQLDDRIDRVRQQLEGREARRILRQATRESRSFRRTGVEPVAHARVVHTADHVASGEVFPTRSGQDTTSAPDLPYQAGEFIPGDRVVVINSVRRPKSWPIHKPWTAEREKCAVVTSRDVPNEKVFITTDNGHRTWRNAKNLKPAHQ